MKIVYAMTRKYERALFLKSALQRVPQNGVAGNKLREANTNHENLGC